jgi:hypothetical protein
MSNATFIFENISSGTSSCGLSSLLAYGVNASVTLTHARLRGSASTSSVLSGDNSTGFSFVINQSYFSDFAEAISPAMAVPDRPRVTLGCNGWQGVDQPHAVPLLPILLGIPLAWVDVVPSVFGLLHCEYPNRGETSSASATVSPTVLPLLQATTGPTTGFAQTLGGITVSLIPTAGLVNPAAIATLQSLQTQSLLTQCEADDGKPLDLASSPTSLRVGSSELSYHYGAILGNVLVLWGCIAVLSLTATAGLHCWYQQQRITVSAALGVLGLPGWLINIYVPLLQPTVASAVAVVCSADAPVATSVVCFAIGCLACALPCGAIANLVIRRFEARAVRSTGEGEEGTAEGVVADIRGALLRNVVVHRLVRERHAYVNAARGSRFVERYGELFTRFCAGRHWFGLVELAHEVIIGVLSGTAPAAAATGSCTAPLAVMAVVSAVTLGLMALLRPYNTLLDAFISTFNESLLLSGCALALILGKSSPANAVIQEVEMYAITVTALLPLAKALLLGRTMAVMHRAMDILKHRVRFPHVSKRLGGAMHRSAQSANAVEQALAATSVTQHTLSRAESLDVLIQIICSQCQQQVPTGTALGRAFTL